MLGYQSGCDRHTRHRRGNASLYQECSRQSEANGAQRSPQKKAEEISILCALSTEPLVEQSLLDRCRLGEQRPHRSELRLTCTPVDDFGDIVGECTANVYG